MSDHNQPPLITTPPGLYEHYKGMPYEVIDTVRHSETLEALVLYQPLYAEALHEYPTRQALLDALAAPGAFRYTIRQQDSQSSFLGNLLWSYSMWFFS